jgi:predicted dehydrogenase
MKRRDFLKAGLATGAGMAVGAPNVLLGASDKATKALNIAQVGAGGRGRAHWRNYARAKQNIVALCDVDAKRAGQAFKKFKDAAKYKDYRAMLEDMGDKIDAVSIATPDHSHHQIAKAAIQMGKHVYLEKPLVQTVPQARELHALAQKHGVVTQMGNQGHTHGRVQMLKEWIDAGIIGDVHEVHVFTNRPVWPQGMQQLPEAQEVPEHLDWELWQAGVTDQPYNEAYLPFKWRGWYAYGTGSLGDMGCHQLDGAFYALALGNPLAVSAVNSSESDVAFPKGSIVTYDFPSRGAHPPLTLKWFDGDMKSRCPQPEELDEGRNFGATGQIIYGSKGTIWVPTTYYGGFRVIPEKKMKEVAPKLPGKTIPRPEGNHFENFVMACQGKIKESSTSFDYAVPLTEMVLLGAIAQRRPSKTLKFDSETGRFSNDETANQIMQDPAPAV